MNLGTRNMKSRLTRYITGNCSADESRILSGLIDTDPGYKKEYQQLLKTWEVSSFNTGSHSFDVDRAWDSVQRKMDRPLVHKGKKPIRIVMPRLATYALRAAAVLLIGFAIYQLTLSHPSEKTFASGNTISAPVTLADGSVIQLNTSSTLKYPEKFAGDCREVYFWGEAFFEIAHDETRPFIIETGETRVKVLGTSFNVKAYPESDRIEVVVNSGKVLFYHVDREDQILGEVMLSKGDKGVYSRTTGLIARIANDEPNFLSWKTGILTFSETSLDKVLSAIGNKYGVSFSLTTQDIADLKLTATFDNESLDAVLQVLELVHNLKFVNNGNDYLVSKKTG